MGIFIIKNKTNYIFFNKILAIIKNNYALFSPYCFFFNSSNTAKAFTRQL